MPRFTKESRIAHLGQRHASILTAVRPTFDAHRGIVGIGSPAKEAQLLVADGSVRTGGSIHSAGDLRIDKAASYYRERDSVLVPQAPGRDGIFLGNPGNRLPLEAVSVIGHRVGLIVTSEGAEQNPHEPAGPQGSVFGNIPGGDGPTGYAGLISEGGKPPGGPPKVWPQQSFEEEPDPKKPGVQKALRSAVTRFNQFAASPIPVLTSTLFDLDIVDRGLGEQLVVTLSGNSPNAEVRLGHFDPALGTFLVYDELQSNVDARAILPLANLRRKQAETRVTSWDYDTGIVRDLRKRHRDTLLQDNLIYKIIGRSNGRAFDDRISDAIWSIDDSTSFFACLIPDFHGRNEPFVGLSFHGLKQVYSYKTPDRLSLAVLHLSQRSASKKYVPARGLITDQEFSRVLALTSELRRLQDTTYPNLDTSRVALRRL